MPCPATTLSNGSNPGALEDQLTDILRRRRDWLLEGCRRSVAEGPKTALLGAQDGERPEQAAQEPATVRHRAPPHDTRQGLPVLQDGTCHGLRAGQGVQKSWRRLDAHALLPKLIPGAKFADRLEVGPTKAGTRPASAAV